MTTPGAGPVCEFCDTGEPAVLSLMKLDDYSNARVGAGCAPAFLRGVADLMDGGQPAADAVLAAGDGADGAPGVVAAAAAEGTEVEPARVAPGPAAQHAQDEFTGRLLAQRDGALQEAPPTLGHLAGARDREEPPADGEVPF